MVVAHNLHVHDRFLIISAGLPLLCHGAHIPSTSSRNPRFRWQNTPREAKRFKLARYLHALRFRRQAQPFFLKSLLHRGTEPQETFPVRARRLPRKLFRNFIKSLSLHKRSKPRC
jgi:hypothetical protein